MTIGSQSLGHTVPVARPPLLLRFFFPFHVSHLSDFAGLSRDSHSTKKLSSVENFIVDSPVLTGMYIVYDQGCWVILFQKYRKGEENGRPIEHFPTLFYQSRSSKYLARKFPMENVSKPCKQNVTCRHTCIREIPPSDRRIIDLGKCNYCSGRFPDFDNNDDNQSRDM